MNITCLRPFFAFFLNMPDTSYIFIVHNFSKVHKNVSCMFDLIRSLTNLNKNTYHRDSTERLNKMMHIFKQKRRYSMRKEKNRLFFQQPFVSMAAF